MTDKRIVTKIKLAASSLVFAAVVFCAIVSHAEDRDTAYNILDSWTCVRWGEDNIAWVVHYPEELVDPWVRSEAERQRMKPDQAEELRKSFSDELRIGSATAVLLSVYGYGASPVNLSPMSENIVLMDSSGNRINPIVFEKKLDSPISGLVQGFVFFPPQTDKNFKIVVNGLVRDRETNFIFPASAGSGGAIATLPDPAAAAGSGNKRTEKEVVVKIPTRKNPTTIKQPSPPSPEPPEIDEPGFEETGETFPPVEPMTPEPAPPAPPEPEPETPQETPKLAPRQVLEIYLKAWADGDADKMYSLLSEESQGKISKELFNRQIMSDNFRSALRSGYKVNWSGDSARVTVARKILFVRTLETKQVNFVMENDSARISW
ncbi:MAG: hypothetical protein LBK91_04460 [Synergistaceae bacterium]|nr:hypothetical protein [Synergistaceae bacterium]